ncbi:MAG: glycosyltransferase family 9 protein [Ignavibacteriales bacterium]|nr:glycosyltransferase family 9 protein [Ignavibacteriales bacterium]
MLLRNYTKDIASGYEGLSEVLTYDHAGKPKSFLEMLHELKRGRYDLAIVAFPRFRIALLLLIAGIPVRVGTGYRWYSFLFNRKVFEHRKTGERHESEYNVGLLRGLGLENGRSANPRLKVLEEDRLAALTVMHESGIQRGEPWVILHPGSGGSARDWSPENFGRLAKALHDDGYKVVITGGPGENEIVQQVVNHSEGKGVPVVGRFQLRELAAFISFAGLFVANSTGPLHIAAAVGTPVIGFYPDIPACSVKRWGPLSEQKKIFVPDRSKCPLCQGGDCRSNICMEQIAVDNVVEAVRELISTPKSVSIET